MILSILNSIGVMFCIYVLISKKYKTDNKKVALLFVFLNIIFIRRLWLVLDPTFTLTPAYIAVNLIALASLYLISSIVKKNIVLDKRSFSTKVTNLFRSIKNKFTRYFKA